MRRIRFAMTLTAALTALAAAERVGADTLPCTPGPPAAFPMQDGMAVATCYAGLSWNQPNGFVLGVVDVRNPQSQGRNWCAPMYHGPASSPWNHTNLGQVFGVSLDDAAQPNIYTTSTRVYNSVGSLFGPGGPGAVYKINGATGTIATHAMLPNTGSGLGNLAFDRQRQQHFVTNFKDGRIYRVDAATGTCLGTFDHATGTITSTCAPESGNLPDFVPLGQRPWGVAVHGGRVYYAIWAQDSGRPGSANTVHSIAIDGTGQFIGSSQLELTLPGLPPSTVSNPVSDIAFTQTGHMRVAERSVAGDIGSGAHQSRVLEFVKTSSTWVASTASYRIGQNTGTNSAGGLANDCSNDVWATGDVLYLEVPPPPPAGLVYGLQKIAGSGNPTYPSLDYFVDLNGVGGFDDKTLIGDVDISHSCACQKVDDVAITCNGDGTYSATFNVTNLSGTDAYFLYAIPSSTNSDITVSPNVIPLNPPLKPGDPPRQVTVQIGGPGANANRNICLIFNLQDQNLKNCCSLASSLHCLTLPSCCASATTKSLGCQLVFPFGFQFQYQVTIRNETSGPIENLFLVPTPPVTFTPSYVQVSPALLPGQSTTVTVTIRGATPMTSLCYNLSIHDKDLKECCSERVCITLPQCYIDFPDIPVIIRDRPVTPIPGGVLSTGSIALPVAGD